MLWQVLISCRSSHGPEIKFIFLPDGWTLSSFAKQLRRGGEVPEQCPSMALLRFEEKFRISSQVKVQYEIKLEFNPS